MAKESYKIPCGLDATYLDMEIALQSSDGIGVRPLSMKVILVYLLSGLGCIWMVMNGFVRFGTIVQKILFVVLWIAITMLLVKTDGTHRMSFVMIPTLITYLQKSTRRILTRKDNSAIPFYSIVGIKKDGIDRKTGLISWADGTYGFMYRVVGSVDSIVRRRQSSDNRQGGFVLQENEHGFRGYIPDDEVGTGRIQAGTVAQEAL